MCVFLVVHRMTAMVSDAKSREVPTYFVNGYSGMNKTGIRYKVRIGARADSRKEHLVGKWDSLENPYMKRMIAQVIEGHRKSLLYTCFM